MSALRLRAACYARLEFVVLSFVLTVVTTFSDCVTINVQDAYVRQPPSGLTEPIDVSKAVPSYVRICA